MQRSNWVVLLPGRFVGALQPLPTPYWLATVHARALGNWVLVWQLTGPFGRVFPALIDYLDALAAPALADVMDTEPTPTRGDAV